jgi:hypothetical protein
MQSVGETFGDELKAQVRVVEFQVAVPKPLSMVGQTVWPLELLSSTVERA